MSNESYYKYLRSIPTNIKLIDYSEENIPFFKNIYESYLIPPIYNYENIDKEIKDIDLLSTRNNEYRENTILFLEERTRKRIDIINNCYHNERDDIYRKTKIYINLHCSDNHNTMELIRICNLLAKKVIVITIKTIFVDLLFLKEPKGQGNPSFTTLNNRFRFPLLPWPCIIHGLKIKTLFPIGTFLLKIYCN
jgi:hypothetical protein